MQMTIAKNTIQQAQKKHSARTLRVYAIKRIWKRRFLNAEDLIKKLHNNSFDNSFDKNETMKIHFLVLSLYLESVNWNEIIIREKYYPREIIPKCLKLIKKKWNLGLKKKCEISTFKLIVHCIKVCIHLTFMD